jgi:hypothetical protein
VRKPKYVSVNTGSVRISVLSANGTAVSVPDTIAAIAFGASGCSPSGSAALQCTVGASAPVGGAVAFRVSTYASANATGAVLSTATVSAAIAVGKTTTLPIALGGVVDHLVVSPTHMVAPSDGAIHVFPLTVSAVDASGATIVGSDAFASAVQLTIGNDPSGALALSQTELTQPGQAVQVKYDGSKSLVDGTISASTSGSGTLEADLAPMNYAPNAATVRITGATQQIALNEHGFTGQFTASVADPTVASVTLSATASGAATLTVAPPAPGSYDGATSIVVSDGTNSGTIPVTVTYPVLSTQYWAAPDDLPWALAPVGSTLYFTDVGNQWFGVFSGGNIADGFATFQSWPGAITAVNGNPWVVQSGWPQTAFCEFFQGRMNCTNLTGADSQSAVPFMTSTPDGTIWFTADYPAAIGSYQPATQTFTIYTTGLSPNANPEGITVGSDGNLWFADNGTPAIGKIVPGTGAITEYTSGLASVNGSNAMPYAITSGPDGNLWFTDQNYAQPAVGKTVPSSGAITEYTAGLQRSPMPTDITVGPDGKLWFSDPSPLGGFGGDYAIATIDTSTDAIQEYILTVAGAQADRLAVMSGSLYFTNSFGIAGTPSGGGFGAATLPGTSPSAHARKDAAVTRRP